MPVVDHPASIAPLNCSKIARPFILALAFLTLVTGASAQSEPTATGIFSRSFCQMGACDWVKALGSSIIYRDAAIKILVIPVASCHISHQGDYPQRARCSTPTVAQEAVVCSKTAPIFAVTTNGKWRAIQLSMTTSSVSKVLEYPHAQYFFYCHGVSQAVHRIWQLIEQFGYSPNDSETQILDDWFDVESLIDLRAKAIWTK